MASHITQTSPVEAKLSRGAVARERHWRIGFFTVMPGVIFLLVLTGFTRTLYARPLFHVRPIPPYLYVHGIVMTTWFALAWVQALLISAGKIANHRRFGVALASFAVVVFCAALMASFGSVSRTGLDLNAPASVMGSGITGITVAQFFSSVVWGNIVNAVSFALFVAGAVIYRRRPQIHKRFMIFASISVLEPALARISHWPGMGGEQGPFIPVVIWSLIAAVAVYDVVSRKRLENCTAIAIVWLLIVRNGAVYISQTHFGLSFIYALGKLRV
jgi:uncharacterized membrane protein YozB (DUF420 family)